MSSDPLKCGPKLANILDALQSEYFLNQSRAVSSANDRRYKFRRLRHDLIAGHGILGRATDVANPLRHLRAIGKGHFDDGLTPWAPGIYPSIGHQLHLSALAQHSGVLQARFVMNGSESKGF